MLVFCELFNTFQLVSSHFFKYFIREENTNFSHIAEQKFA